MRSLILWSPPGNPNAYFIDITSTLTSLDLGQGVRIHLMISVVCSEVFRVFDYLNSPTNTKFLASLGGGGGTKGREDEVGSAGQKQV